MGLDNPKTGMYFAAEFQTSALPYVTCSIAPAASSGCLRVSFPKVTKFFQVTNHSATGNYLRIGFTENGVKGTRYYLMNGGDESQIFDLRIKDLFFAGMSGSVEFSLMAGLTNIDSMQMPTLTGTLSNGGVGWDGVG